MLLSRIDHLVYAAPDLDAGIDEIDRRLGVRASPGGRHPGLGTRNALVALGPACYLEIIGPDPEQRAWQEPRPFGIDRLSAPALVTWAAKGDDLDRLSGRDLGSGARVGRAALGSRMTVDGERLSWRFTDPHVVVADGLVPFFIDWGITPHPARAAAQGPLLLELRAEHPDPRRVRGFLEQLGLELPVTAGPKPALIAAIRGGHGEVELR